MIDRYTALVNAFDVLEIAVRDGSAAAALGAKKGARVLLEGATS